jgi:heme-degrading monooxygenase HmoA
VIARIWRGWTAREDAEAYARYLVEIAAPDSLGTPGNYGFSVLHRPDGDREEFLTISLWESLDVVRAFAGEDVERAVFYPEDDRFLVEREPTVAHFEYLPAGEHPAEA